MNSKLLGYFYKIKKPARMEIFSQERGHMQGKKRTRGNPKLITLTKGKIINFLLSEVAILPKSRHLQH
jgi:hypothetical protein